MKKVAGNQRLLRRNGVYYYRRRVPQRLMVAPGAQDTASYQHEPI